MLIYEHFNVILTLFKLFGIAKTPKKKKETRLKHFKDYVPGLITMLIGLGCAIYLVFIPPFKPYSSVHAILSYARLIGFLCVIISANCQCFFYRSNYKNIHYRISRLEQRCKEMFSATFPRKMAFHYKLKVLLIFSLFLVAQGLVLTEVLIISGRKGLLSFFLNLSLRSIYPIAVVHVVLYGDLITMFIEETNLQIRKTAPKSFYPSIKIEFLRNVKLLHMDLWKLVAQLNIFFGWSLLVLIITSFIYITSQLYWIFLALELNWHKLAMIEGLASSIYGSISLLVLVNSCQSGSLKIKYLVANIELQVFGTTSDVQLHYMKEELFSQINHFPIYITGSEFFTIDRKYFAGIVASCCMYIIIFIQFFVSANDKKAVEKTTKNDTLSLDQNATFPNSKEIV